MSTEKTESKGKVAKATKPAKTPPIDLATAKVANGALSSPRSVYEIMGITNGLYRTSDYETYSEDIKAMSLSSLHEHAYEVGVAATGDRANLIDALERKFIQEHGRQGRAREASAKRTQAESMRDQALRALAHGA